MDPFFLPLPAEDVPSTLFLCWLCLSGFLWMSWSICIWLSCCSSCSSVFMVRMLSPSNIDICRSWSGWVLLVAIVSYLQGKVLSWVTLLAITVDLFIVECLLTRVAIVGSWSVTASYFDLWHRGFFPFKAALRLFLRSFASLIPYFPWVLYIFCWACAVLSSVVVLPVCTDWFHDEPLWFVAPEAPFFEFRDRWWAGAAPAARGQFWVVQLGRGWGGSCWLWGSRWWVGCIIWLWGCDGDADCYDLSSYLLCACSNNYQSSLTE